MMKPIFYSLAIFFAFSVAMTSCTSKPEAPLGAHQTTEILPSWNNKVRMQIVNYVQKVTTQNGPDFIPEEDRIATFDNDGTLWSEKPVTFQILFAVDEVKRMASAHPEWATEEPFKSAIEDDMTSLMLQGSEGVMKLIMATHTGISNDEFTQNVQNWLSTAVHPIKKVKYTDLVYQPMLELLDYLRGNGFKTFIVSGGELAFMRAWTAGVYGIPPYQVIGTSFNTEYVFANDTSKIMRLPSLNFYDDKANKPLAIERHIGIRPVFAAGNSDGDFEMLQYADGNTYTSFQLYISHTDGAREFSYGRTDHLAPLDKGLDYALEHDWCVLDMENDWNRVFPGDSITHEEEITE